MLFVVAIFAMLVGMSTDVRSYDGDVMLFVLATNVATC